MIRAALRFLRLLPARLELEYMRAARRQMPVLHRDIGFVVSRISELEDALK